jgi:AcrR family transcriptional regulator
MRARKAFDQALQDLLKTMPYEDITVTDIAHRSGYSRHTFYNHYQTKDELLDSLIDSILDEFFGRIGPWEAVRRDADGDVRIGQRFFEAWGPHADVVRLLHTVDIDHLLIGRLRAHFTKYFEERIIPVELTGVSDELITFIITLLTYSYAGVLRQWLLYDMRYSPEVMGRFLTHFIGRDTATVLAKFKDEIR